MSRSIKQYLLLILVITLFIPCQLKATEPVYFENYNEEQGLVHSYVLCMFQDSWGIMWVGTYGGVQAFNGYNFNLFNVSGKKTNILTNHVVNVIFEDKDKNLWFGTESGLNKYNPKTGAIVRYLNNAHNTNCLSNNNVKSIYQDNDGIFWIGTYGGGLNRLDEKNNNFTSFRAKRGDKNFLQSDLINTFFVDKNGLFWIGTENGGVTIFDKNKNKVVNNFQSAPGRLSHGTVNSICQDMFGNYWIGTWDGGLNKYDPTTKKFTYFYPKSSFKKGQTINNIRCILQTEKDFLWVSTFGEGLCKFDLKTEEFVKVNINTTKDGISAQDLIWTLYEDNENNLWIGTFGKGILKQNTLKNTFLHYDLKQPDNTKLSISSIVQYSPDEMLIGTLNRGMYFYNLKTKTYKKYSPPQIQNESIGKIYLDRKNRLWISAENILYLINSDRKTIRKFAYNPSNNTSITENSINAILEDRLGNIWIGFWGTGINVIKNGELDKKKDDAVIFTKYLNNKSDTFSMFHTRIWSFFEDSKGTVWIGTSGNLVYYNPHDGLFKTLPIKVVSSFYEDPYGYLWVGSIGYGLYKLNKDYRVVKKYQQNDGLPCLDVLSIMADKNGRMWMGTAMGITLFDPQSESISNFDKYYGLQSFNINPNACITLLSSQMIFGGNNGFYLFKPDEITQDFIKSPIIITDIKLNNKSIAYENVMDSTSIMQSSIADLESLKLDYKNKVLTIDFAAVNYTIPSSITYAYMLEGFDEDWVNTSSSNRTATYTNLNNGDYVFKVRMSYSKGKWLESIRKLKVTITPPYWKKLWFIILIITAFGSVIWLILWFILGRNRLRTLIKQKLYVTERLSKEKEVLQLRYDQISENQQQQNKKWAYISLKNQTLKDELKTIHTNLLDIKSIQPNLNNTQLTKAIQSLNEQINGLNETEGFNDNINILFDDFVKRFADNFQKLTSTDIRICALIRMNKSNKEIAKQLNIALGSLETSRHRIRKKLSLPTDVNLNDFILRF